LHKQASRADRRDDTHLGWFAALRNARNISPCVWNLRNKRYARNASNFRNCKRHTQRKKRPCVETKRKHTQRKSQTQAKRNARKEIGSILRTLTNRCVLLTLRAFRCVHCVTCVVGRCVCTVAYVALRTKCGLRRVGNQPLRRNEYSRASSLAAILACS